MKLEKNMYVITDKGRIGKVITDEYELKDEYANDIEFNDGVEDTYYMNDTIVDANYDIIKLLRPLDLIYVDISPDDYGGIVVPRIAETLGELEKYKEYLSTGYWILKGVVTKEQLVEKLYEVGEK